jgi:hypothetical protein
MPVAVNGGLNKESVMLKTVFVSATAIALAGIAGGALAAGYGPGPGQYTVDVNIEVEEVVSLWANNDTITLTMNGFDANNTAWADSSLSVINNTDSKIEVMVDGTLPAPIVPGGGIYFHIFDNQPADVSALFMANGYGNANARTWTDSTLGTTQTLFASTGVHTSIENFPITYAATAPGEIPLPDSFALEVVYTISALP